MSFSKAPLSVWRNIGSEVQCFSFCSLFKHLGSPQNRICLMWIHQHRINSTCRCDIACAFTLCCFRGVGRVIHVLFLIPVGSVTTVQMHVWIAKAAAVSLKTLWDAAFNWQMELWDTPHHMHRYLSLSILHWASSSVQRPNQKMQREVFCFLELEQHCSKQLPWEAEQFCDFFGTLGLFSLSAVHSQSGTRIRQRFMPLEVQWISPAFR